MWRLVVLVPLAACNALIGVHDFDRAGDGGVDALPDADPGPCTADQVTCTVGGNAVQKCASDGSANMVIEGCAASCIADAAGAHCAYLAPHWLPDICDTRATGDLTVTSANK